MNDWDKQDNFPPQDDDDDGDFGWLDDDDSFDWLDDEADGDEESAPDEWGMPRPARAEREIADQMDAAEDADFGNTDELLDWMSDPDEDGGEAVTDDGGHDVPDWLQGMDLPEASDEEIAAAQQNVLGATADDSDDEDDADFDAIFGSDDEPSSSGGDIWGDLGGDDEDDADFDAIFGGDDKPSSSGGDIWGDLGGDDEDDEDDAGVDFATLLGASDANADDADEAGVDFDELLGLSGANEDTDEFLVQSSLDEADDESDLFDDLLGGSDDDDSPFDSGTSNSGDSLWGDLEDFEDEPIAETAGTDGSIWGDLEDDFEDEIPDTSEEAGDLWGDLEDVEEDSLEGAALSSDSLWRDEDASSEPDTGTSIWDSEDAFEVGDSFDGEETPADFYDEMFEEASEPTDAVPDWLDQAESDAGELDDLLAELDSEEGDGDLDDLLAELEGDEGDGGLDDLLAELEGDEGDGGLDDLLGGLDTGDEDAGLDDLFDTLGTDEAEEPQAAAADDLNFLDDIETEEPQAAAADDLSFLDDIETEEAQAAAADDLSFLDDIETEEAQAAAADDLSFFDSLEDDDEQTDWFADADSDQADNDLSFLDEVVAEAAEPGEDWLSALDDAAIEADRERELADEGEVDLDALIATFDAAGAIDDDGDIELAAADLDAILDSMDEEQRSAIPDDISPEELPEWLREIASGQDRESAAALIRQRRDRSLDDLDDRLLELRERGLELGTASIAAASAEPESAAGMLPNTEDALAPARIDRTELQSAMEPVFTADQQARAEILAALTSAAGSSAAAARGRRRLWLPQGLDRMLVTLILFAAVLAPFTLSEFDGVAVLPPFTFAEDSPENAAFTLMEGLEPNDSVLFAAEYGATGARELDTATRAFMEHMLVNGAKPVIVSTDAIGLLRAENIAVSISGDEKRNEAYVIGGFLPGGTLGLRDFVNTLGTRLQFDTQGDPTGLMINDLDDFEAIVLVAESGDTVRNWMEQIAPQTSSPIIVFTGQSARPLAVPYVQAVDNAITLMSGYDDAFTYQQMALAIYNPTSTPTGTAIFTPTEQPSATPEPSETAIPASETPIPTGETGGAAAVDEDETEEAVATEPPTDTSEPATNTPAPTETSAPPTGTPTEEPVTPTDIPQIEVGTIVATGAINVRSGAGSTFDVIDTLQPGQRVRVLELSADAEWVRIVLPDGDEGWVALFLIDIETIPATEFDGADVPSLHSFAKRVRPIEQDDDLVPIARNVAGIPVSVYDNPAFLNEPIATLATNQEVLVLEAGDTATQILLDDGREGFVETRLIRITDVPRSDVPFVPTPTPTPIPPTPTPSPTLIPSPTPFVIQVTPSPLPSPEQRSGSTAIGLVAAIAIIGLGNAYWIFRWMRRRES